ncbi:MAG: hypothetical protein H7A31_04805, partial [Thermotogae bacterium]|nr:hypothetical protein [Thermotogota bacterium]
MNKKILIFIILIISVFSFPDTIKIISPENNSENVDIKIIFRWDYAQNENIKYKVIISESSDFIKNTVLYENIYAKFFSGNIFKSETTYYIKIEAYRDNLLTGTSGTVKFKTRAYRYGDIIWNEFEKYDNIIPYYEGNQFLYINGNEIEIKDFDKKVIFRQKFDFKVTNAKIINDSIYIYEGKNLYIYDKEFHFSNVYFPDEIKEVLTPFNVVTKNGIYYFEDGKIKNKIDITDNKNIYFFKDKIYYMINSVFYVYDKTLTPEYSKTFDNITFNRIFFINSMDKIVLGNMKEIYFFEKNFDYVGKISFQNMNYNNYEVYDLIGNYGVVFDNKEINIFNGMFVKINQNALENDTQKIVGFNSEKYLVSGKLIKSIGIKNNPVWYYGSISSIQVISQPVVIKNGIFIGIKDYIDRFMIFYEETQTGNYWEGITTSGKNDNTLPDAETTPESSEVTLPDAEIT